MPSFFVSELPGLCLGGASSSGAGADLGPWTGPRVASPDFLPCPYLGPWEKLLYLASLHPQGTQLLRNSQLLPSPTLSFQTKPVKTDLWWQLRPHLAAAHVHGPRSISRLWSPRRSPLQMHTKPGWTLSLRHIQERSAWELVDSVFFFWLHPNQMELNICAPACPFIAGTGS